jgi:hypothetical protein
MMTKSILCCVAVVALVMAATVAGAQQRTDTKRVAPGAGARAHSTGEDCEAWIRKLDASDAEGEERLRVKNDAIEHCDAQYRRDKTIEGLVRECAKYEEQAIIKQQSVAECQLAAYGYANALYTLRAGYRK